MKERKKEREKEEVKRGRPKKGKEKQRQTLKNEQKCSFLGGKTSFFY